MTDTSSEIKEYYDSRSGELIRVQRQICGRCHNSIPLSGEGHAACRRAFLQEEAANNEEIRKQQCLAQFGAVLSREEQQWRTYPDSRTFGYNETYNQYLKRIEQEKRQAYYDRRTARTNRKERQLPSLSAINLA